MDPLSAPPVELVTVAELARRLRLPRARAEALVVDESFPAVLGTIGNQPFWAWADVAAWWSARSRDLAA